MPVLAADIRAIARLYSTAFVSARKKAKVGSGSGYAGPMPGPLHHQCPHDARQVCCDAKGLDAEFGGSTRGYDAQNLT
jgi:hypothetical protein